MELSIDNENQMRQIRAQEDAIIQAQNLKDKTDMMLRDYEKTRSELNNASMRNEELFRELEFFRC